MNDPRRVHLPWYSQRWYLRYILPAALFWYMAIWCVRHPDGAPITAAVVALFFAAIAIFFTRTAWQERNPLRRLGQPMQENEPLPTARDLCQTCGYDLRGTDGCCPECGTPIASKWL